MSYNVLRTSDLGETLSFADVEKKKWELADYVTEFNFQWMFVV